MRDSIDNQVSTPVRDSVDSQVSILVRASIDNQVSILVEGQHSQPDLQNEGQNLLTAVIYDVLGFLSSTRL